VEVNGPAMATQGVTRGVRGAMPRCNQGIGVTSGGIGVTRGAKGAMPPPNILENIVIFCFKRRFSKQNSVIRLKSNILAPPKFLGWLRHSCVVTQKNTSFSTGNASLSNRAVV